MQISIRDDAGQTATMVLKGRLDLAGAGEVAPSLSKLSEAKSGLVIDMSDITSITSPGIRQIVAANKALARRGGRLVLLKPNETVVRVLGATGVSGLITLVYSERDATTALRTG